nr:MAG TPA: hypothetical protein [Caudoviricetes sp.]
MSILLLFFFQQPLFSLNLCCYRVYLFYYYI